MPAALHRTSIGLALAIAVTAVVFSGVVAQARVTDPASTFVTRINQERQAAGLPAYAPAADLEAVARRHAQRMADRGEWYHNPNLTSEVIGWSIVAENVGSGPEVEALHQAFMASPSHRANVMSDQLTQVGIGVVQTADATLWVVQVFRQPMRASAAPASHPTTPAPAPAPALAPAPAPVPAPAAPAPTPTTAAAPAPTTTVPPTATAAAPTTTPPPAELARSAGGSTTSGAAVGSPARPVAGASTVPAAAWLAAALLAGVVGLQTESVRRICASRR